MPCSEHFLISWSQCPLTYLHKNSWVMTSPMHNVYLIVGSGVIDSYAGWDERFKLSSSDQTSYSGRNFDMSHRSIEGARLRQRYLETI